MTYVVAIIVVLIALSLLVKILKLMKIGLSGRIMPCKMFMVLTGKATMF